MFITHNTDLHHVWLADTKLNALFGFGKIWVQKKQNNTKKRAFDSVICFLYLTGQYKPGEQ